jgi:diguanylate cyclase (GGDEF)-like protein/putative nucleotidyltransferase with HDIG domain
LANKPQLKALPTAARVAVLLFGMVGICGVIRAAFDTAAISSSYFVLMAFLAVVTAHTKVRLIGGSSLSLLTTVALVAVMMLGPKPAVLVGVIGVITQCAIPPRRFIFHHLIFNLGMIVVTISAVGAGYYAVVRQTPAPAGDLFIGSLIASLIYYLGNSLCVSLIVALSNRKSFFRLWHDNFLYTAPSFFVAGLLAALVAHFASSFRVTVLLVVVPILYLCFYSYQVYLRSLENEKKHSSEMAELFNSTLSTLALAIDAKDPHTHGHIQRVQKYSRAIAEAMGLDEQQIKSIAAAALLHDIGKLAIPEYILSKHGPLTADEMQKMRQHPQLGADIISNIKFPYPVVDSILAHHEYFDGTGYPGGLKGKDIPLGARILAVADVFDAYTSDRVQCEETLDGAIRAIREGSATCFDPDVVTIWESIYRDVVVWSSPPASSTAYRNIHEATSENAMALETARREAAIDKLTGLANRRAFEKMSASLGGTHFSVVLIDVNAFKAVNDNFGHHAGDAALARIGTHLRSAFHDAQLICRLGGDEFLVLSQVDRRNLRMQIRTFRRIVLWDPAHEPYKKMLFGVSCGLATVPIEADTIEEAMQRADERMYAVKARFKQWASRVFTV